MEQTLTQSLTNFSKDINKSKILASLTLIFKRWERFYSKAFNADVINDWYEYITEDVNERKFTYFEFLNAMNQAPKQLEYYPRYANIHTIVNEIRNKKKYDVAPISHQLEGEKPLTGEDREKKIKEMKELINKF